MLGKEKIQTSKTRSLKNRLSDIQRKQDLISNFGAIEKTLGALRNLNDLFADRDKIESTAQDAFERIQEDLRLNEGRDMARFVLGGLDPEGQIASQILRSRQMASNAAEMRVREEEEKALSSSNRNLILGGLEVGAVAWLLGALFL